GRVDLVVSQNGAETKLYRNERGEAGLRVKAVGSGGYGFGAVLRMGAGGKWGPAREVHGGSGYWSQDSAVQVMSRGKEPAIELQVRWPGGKTTISPIPAGAHEIEMDNTGSSRKIK